MGEGRAKRHVRVETVWVIFNDVRHGLILKKYWVVQLFLSWQDPVGDGPKGPRQKTNPIPPMLVARVIPVVPVD